MSVETELAWSAGFFDGEGCSSVTHRPVYKGRKARTQLVLVVTQCGHEAPILLERFRAAVDAGFLQRPIKRGVYLDHYRWQIGSIAGGLNVMRQLWPYLGPVKKRQFIKALRESARDFRLRKTVKRTNA